MKNYLIILDYKVGNIEGFYFENIYCSHDVVYSLYESGGPIQKCRFCRVKTSGIFSFSNGESVNIVGSRCKDCFHLSVFISIIFLEPKNVAKLY